jgi:hypothetical protein
MGTTASVATALNCKALILFSYSHPELDGYVPENQRLTTLLFERTKPAVPQRAAWGLFRLAQAKNSCCDALLAQKETTPRLSGSLFSKKLTTEPAKVTMRSNSLSSVL